MWLIVSGALPCWGEQHALRKGFQALEIGLPKVRGQPADGKHETISQT